MTTNKKEARLPGGIVVVVVSVLVLLLVGTTTHYYKTLPSSSSQYNNIRHTSWRNAEILNDSKQPQVARKWYWKSIHEQLMLREQEQHREQDADNMLYMEWNVDVVKEKQQMVHLRMQNLVDAKDNQDIAMLIAFHCQHEKDNVHVYEVATLEHLQATRRVEEAQDEESVLLFAFPMPTMDASECHASLWKAHASQEHSVEFVGHTATPLQRHPHPMQASPVQIHLALTNQPSEMLVQFRTTGSSSSLDVPAAQSVVAMWGRESPTKLDQKTTSDIPSTTYTAQDFCGPPANETEFFVPPGIFHQVKLTDLEANTKYYYKVGVTSGQGIVWSDVQSFLSPPLVGDASSPFSFVVYADQGTPEIEYSQGSQWIANAMRQIELPNVRMIHHFGDLSYARGTAHLWDTWMDLISPYASQVPYMVGGGNHEYDHSIGISDNAKDPSGTTTPFTPVWGNFGDDSGGECGIPVVHRFQMPQSSKGSNGVFWYSFDYASVHTIMLSSEHDLSSTSPQGQWLQADLQGIDRQVTPWVIVELHRPLYNSQDVGLPNWRDIAVALGMRQEMEYLLRDYQVDLVLAGHYHSYLRTCDGLYLSRCQNQGPTHITVGTAGASLGGGRVYPNLWTEKHLVQFGYGRITVANATAMHFEFVAVDDPEAPQSLNGKVLDDVWIRRPGHLFL